MNKYIDVDKFAEAICSFRQIDEDAANAMIWLLRTFPTADVIEARNGKVRHGKWVLVKPRRIGRNATYQCSVCKKLRSSYYNDVQNWKYCPCGAKMDRERKKK